MTNRDLLFIAILECGTNDLSMIDDIGYDFYEIVNSMKENGLDLSLNNVLKEIFLQGIYEVREALKNKISDFRSELEELENTDEEVERIEYLRGALEDLYNLSPDTDIDFETNCSASMIYFMPNGNKEQYWKYLEDELNNIEDNMGFSFN